MGLYKNYMNNEIYNEYAELTKSIEILEEQRNALKEKIVEDLNKNELQKLQTDSGTFSMSKKVSYKFSKDLEGYIEATKKEIDARKELAIEKGEAIATETPFLRFQVKK